MRTITAALALGTATLFSFPADSDAHGFGSRFGHRAFGVGHFHGHDSVSFTRAYRARLGSLRIDSFPAELSGSRVLINGASVGVVSDFDGFFQRLSLLPGNYEVEIQVAGDQSVRRNVFITQGRTYRLRYGDALPSASGASEVSTRPRTDGLPQAGTRATSGFVQLITSPADARGEVFVNGAHAGAVEEFDGIFQALSLPGGTYDIEIRQLGGARISQSVLVTPGQTRRLRYSPPELSAPMAEMMDADPMKQS